MISFNDGIYNSWQSKEHGFILAYTGKSEQIFTYTYIETSTIFESTHPFKLDYAKKGARLYRTDFGRLCLTIS